jgi:hypothetical protein
MAPTWHGAVFALNVDMKIVTKIGSTLTIASLLIAAGCTDDIWDVEVNLKTETYRADFGSATGTIPIVTCDPADPGVCSDGSVVTVNTAATGMPADVQVSPGCDATTDRCFVQATARVAYPVDVLQDDAFTSAVASRTVTFVRVADFVYTVPANSLTFDVPQIDIYVGPAGSTQETDPGVVAVGSTRALPAGTTLTDGHITVDDGSPARATIEDNIRNQLPLVFLVVLSPRLAAGSAIPAGALEVDVSPQLLIGLPR